MSDLESQIRNLTLRAPGAAIDQRVLSVLQTPAMRVDTGGSFETATAESATAVQESERMSGFRLTGDELRVSAESAESRPVIRRGIAATVVWLVAAASLLIGIAVGQRLPPSTGNTEGPVGAIDGTWSGTKRTDGTRPFRSIQESASSDPETDFMPQAFTESFTVTSEEELSGSGQAPQIVDTVSLSPRDAANTWQQRTGQIFNVATHVQDRRFNMCRECHRIGG